MTWEDIQRELDDQQGILARVLPDVLSKRLFGDLEQRRQEHERRRARVREQYEEMADSGLDLRDDLESTLGPAMEAGEPLPADADDVRMRAESTLTMLDQFRSSVDVEYLTESERATVARVEESLSEFVAFVPHKRRFDERIEQLEASVERLQADARPFLDSERYLTYHEREAIDRRCDEIRHEARTLRSNVEWSLLADADRERLEGVLSSASSVTSYLDGYNDRFVDDRITACEDLFTAIGEEGIDLDWDQREAVVRNDTYNQVVAAAGTGKTLVLTRRVAYLVLECGVPPDRIVALTYTREAASEMEARLAEVGITNVTVRTLHSFGYRIAREATDGDPQTVQSGDVYNLVEDTIREETTKADSEFADHYFQFLYHYEDEYLDRADFESRAEYVAERAERNYETLAGESVASQAEKVVADFLFTHGVEYQYEAIAEWANTAEDKGPYRPDFYLPAYDLYVEHWGIDESGEVAPWFSWSTKKYRRKLGWARGEFTRNDPSLVETYDFEHERDPDHLRAVLRNRLERHGVELDRTTFEDLVDSTFEYHEKERDIREAFVTFVENAKTFGVSPTEIPLRLDPDRPRQYHFGTCGATMLERYDDFLDRNDLVDFDDMIYDAIDAIEADPAEYRRRYDHLLVDEFQDVSMSQMRLVDELTGPDGAKLFCVGDDWQSIYSFQGSQVEYFVDFETHFGPATKTHLTENYRCPVTVLEAGNDLVRNNDDQISKEVTAASGKDVRPRLHTLDGYTDDAYARRVGEYAADLVEQFVSSGSDPGDVMVLCRYDSAAPYLDRLESELEAREIPYDGKDDHYRPDGMAGERSDDFDPNAGVSAFSVHQSKGREAEHVVVLHVADGQFGFPAGDRDDELVAPVRDVPTNTRAEERRLFYVALTRTEGTLDVLTKQGAVSPFVREIRDYLEDVRSVVAPGEVGDRTELTAEVTRLFADPHPKKRQEGVLEDGTGTLKFVSWENEDPPEVETNVWYRFENVRVDEFRDERRIVVSGDANVVELYRERPA